ncbi:hypotheical protein [Mycobacterium phage PP]|uniref:Hypotheical protein n=1 Tax=Mycobacterium phage PP TaxID=2077134 RepID=A0A2Z5XVI9_9CAUD|nr:site-specific recombination directionality factor RDF [Mycobacterium phage PP]BBC53870.1 hypotheical protein [Mycobacterium phage PP]
MYVGSSETRHRATVKAWIIAALIAGAFVGLGLYTSAPAEAAPSAACIAHLADKKTHTTPAADRRYHLQRGQHSPCTEEDAGESASERRDDDDRKSRFCRKRWYC